MTDYDRLSKQAEIHRKMYPPGTRLYLSYMSDKYAPVPPGTRGTVEYVDDMDNIHMRWITTDLSQSSPMKTCSES